MADSKRSTLDDFRDGRGCQFIIDVEVVENEENALSFWKAVVKTSDGELLSRCEGDTPADAIAGATAAANGTLARLHLAARFGSEEMKARLADLESDDS